MCQPPAGSRGMGVRDVTGRQQSVPPRFGRRLQREREARHWSLREAAEKAGVAAATIMRAEQGRDVALSNAIAFAAAYGVSMDALLAGSACEVCDGMPPDGFACLSCGAGNRESAATTEGAA